METRYCYEGRGLIKHVEMSCTASCRLFSRIAATQQQQYMRFHTMRTDMFLTSAYCTLVFMCRLSPLFLTQGVRCRVAVASLLVVWRRRGCAGIGEMVVARPSCPPSLHRHREGSVQQLARLHIRSHWLAHFETGAINTSELEQFLRVFTFFSSKEVEWGCLSSEKEGL